MRDNFQIWVDAVCEQVRFRPDRKGIEKELRTHYEDHYQDLIRLNYAPELAAERALNAMGNAQEVGWALDRVHKPWLGWLWGGTRVLLLALTALVLVSLFFITGLPELAERVHEELSWEEPPAGAARVELEHATLWAAPGDMTEWDGHAVAEIRLWIRMRDPIGGPNSGRTWFFTCRDDQGEIPLAEFDEIARTWPESRYWRYGGWHEGWTRFQQTMELVLEQPPQWAEISYPLSGQNWTLRVEWEAKP